MQVNTHQFLIHKLTTTNSQLYQQKQQIKQQQIKLFTQLNQLNKQPASNQQT